MPRGRLQTSSPGFGVSAQMVARVKACEGIRIALRRPGYATVHRALHVEDVFLVVTPQVKMPEQAGTIWR